MQTGKIKSMANKSRLLHGRSLPEFIRVVQRFKSQRFKTISFFLRELFSARQAPFLLFWKYEEKVQLTSYMYMVGINVVLSE